MTILVRSGCFVCSPGAPCLFDVRDDPSETKNLAAGNAAVVKSMLAKLVSYVPYIPDLTPGNLACYSCAAELHAPPVLWWQNFSGPCCILKKEAVTPADRPTGHGSSVLKSDDSVEERGNPNISE